MKDSRLDEALRHLHPPPGKKLWHGGPTVLGAIRGLSPEVARWKPYPDRHSIWALALRDARAEVRDLGRLSPYPAVLSGVLLARRSPSLRKAPAPADTDAVVTQVPVKATVSELVAVIVGEYRERAKLADEYDAEIDRTEGWTPIGGTEGIRRRREQIEARRAAAGASEALLAMDPPMLDAVVEALESYAEELRGWHPWSQSALAGFLKVSSTRSGEARVRARWRDTGRLCSENVRDGTMETPAADRLTHLKRLA